MQKYNIYLDESSIDNPKNDFMVIGWIFIKRELKPKIIEEIKQIRQKYNYFAELKWSKFNKKLVPFAKEVIDLFFSYPVEDLQFHCILIDKTEILYDIYHDGDKELAFYKFIYFLLIHKFKNNSIYYLFLDYKDNNYPNRIKDLYQFLNKFLKKKSYNTVMKHIQSYCSRQLQLIQLADFFIGAVWYKANWFNKSYAKNEIITYIEKKLKHDITLPSPKSEEKFNIFKIKLWA